MMLATIGSAALSMYELGDRDSNPDLLIQSQLYCHYTIPHRTAPPDTL